MGQAERMRLNGTEDSSWPTWYTTPLRPPLTTHEIHHFLSIEDIEDVAVKQMVRDHRAMPHRSRTTDMPMAEQRSVARCVASVASAYQDALDLVREIRKRGRARGAVRSEAPLDAAAEELELSCVRGQEVIRAQYDRDHRRLGTQFAEGDGRSTSNSRPWRFSLTMARAGQTHLA